MSYPTYDETFQSYSRVVLALAAYPGRGRNAVYPAMKLAGEAGEVADKIGKHWRNYNTSQLKEAVPPPVHIGMDGASMTDDQREAVALELGDCLWYIAAIAVELGFSLEQIALMNKAKLAGRAQRGTILGEGDNR